MSTEPTILRAHRSLGGRDGSARTGRAAAAVATAARYAVLSGLSLVFLFPFWWLVSSSLKGPNEISRTPPTPLPQSPRWLNYAEVFTVQPFARQLYNSVYLALVVTVGVLAVSAVSGYAFARLRFRGQSVIFVVLLSALMMPSEVTIVPLFTLMRVFGLVNTHIPLVLIPMLGPQAVLGAFLMRQFFLGLPRETEEAGMVDGLGYFGVFRRLALPLARPALGALGIVTFLYSWNLLLEPLVFLDDPDLYTVPLGLNSFTNAYGIPMWNLRLAATCISIVPTFVAYVVARRQLVESFAFAAGK